MLAIWNHGVASRRDKTLMGNMAFMMYVIKRKHLLRYSPFVRGIHRSPVNFPHKGQWRGALMFSLVFARINDWVNNREAGDLRRHRAHYDVTVMLVWHILKLQESCDMYCLGKFGYIQHTIILLENCAASNMESTPSLIQFKAIYAPSYQECQYHLGTSWERNRMTS